VDDRTRDPPRLERAVRVVDPVRERLAGEAEPLGLGGRTHRGRGGEADENEALVCPGHRAGERRGELRIADRLVVEGAVRLHVHHAAVPGTHEGGERPHLVEDVGLDLVRRRLDRPAAEAPEIVVAGVRADRDPLLHRHPHGAVHDHRIAGVETARHVRRGDDLEDLLVAAEVVVAEAFAHVTVEVDAHGPILRNGARPRRRGRYSPVTIPRHG